MKIEVQLDLTPAQLAQAFCDLDDEQQAQFFIDAARIARETWEAPATFLQWREVGKHLATCACSTDDARELVRDIAEGMDAAPGSKQVHAGGLPLAPCQPASEQLRRPPASFPGHGA